MPPPLRPPRFALGLAFTLLAAAPAWAKPVAPALFCAAYPNAPACARGPADCTTCHLTPPALNLFGRSVATALAPGAARPLDDAAFAAALPAALAAAAPLDADGDGAPSADELAAGSAPGDPKSTPNALSPCAAGDRCTYDAAYAFRKVNLDFCGRSATYEEREAFAAEPDPKAALHRALDACVQSDFWRGKDGVLWNLANPKIKPLRSVKGGEGPGPIPLADYDDDYALFVYTQIDNHDARDLLLARYYVARVPGPTATAYEPFQRTVVEDYYARPADGAFQTLEAPERAGMLTTHWFRIINTMFTSVPRTTAAQAYRAYLGLDIALLQGLSPVAGEPRDFDNKGVGAPGCANCHATLDPLAYPFSRYEAIDADEKTFVEYFTQYRPDRMTRFVGVDGPRIVEAPEAGVIFGQPVANLIEWATVAAESDAFAEALVNDYWQLIFGDAPRPAEEAEFHALWSRFRGENAYGVDRMLHDLIDTEAYGVP